MTFAFVPSGDNAGWLRDRLGSEVGPIVDQDGNKIGEHKGAYTYTIGQRKGLGANSSHRRWFSSVCL